MLTLTLCTCAPAGSPSSGASSPWRWGRAADPHGPCAGRLAGRARPGAGTVRRRAGGGAGQDTLRVPTVVRGAYRRSWRDRVRVPGAVVARLGAARHRRRGPVLPGARPGRHGPGELVGHPGPPPRSPRAGSTRAARPAPPTRSVVTGGWAAPGDGSAPDRGTCGRRGPCRPRVRGRRRSSPTRAGRRTRPAQRPARPSTRRRPPHGKCAGTLRDAVPGSARCPGAHRGRAAVRGRRSRPGTPRR